MEKQEIVSTEKQKEEAGQETETKIVKTEEIESKNEINQTTEPQPVGTNPPSTQEKEEDKYNKESKIKKVKKSKSKYKTINLNIPELKKKVQPPPQQLKPVKKEISYATPPRKQRTQENPKNPQKEVKSKLQFPEDGPEDEKTKKRTPGSYSFSGEKMKELLTQKNQYYAQKNKESSVILKTPLKDNSSKNNLNRGRSIIVSSHQSSKLDSSQQNSEQSENSKKVIFEDFSSQSKQKVNKKHLKKSVETLHSSLEETRFQRDQFKNLLAQIHNELHNVISKKDQKLKNLQNEISSLKSKYQQQTEQLDRVKELPTNEKKDEELRRNLFFSLALAIKLSLSMSGRASNKDLQVLYEHIETKRFTKISEWPTFILEFLTEGEQVRRVIKKVPPPVKRNQKK